jgi:hypothetical protein
MMPDLRYVPIERVAWSCDRCHACGVLEVAISAGHEGIRMLAELEHAAENGECALTWCGIYLRYGQTAPLPD